MVTAKPNIAAERQARRFPYCIGVNEAKLSLADVNRGEEMGSIA
jgi:hypothetical protein